MRNILIIARRGLRAQFNSPVAYVVVSLHSPWNVMGGPGAPVAPVDPLPLFLAPFQHPAAESASYLVDDGRA